VTFLRSPIGVDPKAPNRREEAGTERNQTRLAQANQEDERTLGEPQRRFLPSDPASFLPEPVTGPDDSFSPPAWFLHELTVIAATPCPTPRRSTVQFEVSHEAAQHNADLLRTVDYDITTLANQKAAQWTGANSTSFSARPLGRHPNF
jgi:hypothetical protein